MEKAITVESCVEALLSSYKGAVPEAELLERTRKATDWLYGYYTANELSSLKLHSMCTNDEDRRWLLEEIFG